MALAWSDEGLKSRFLAGRREWQVGDVTPFIPSSAQRCCNDRSQAFDTERNIT
jgi:hypothetical protein